MHISNTCIMLTFVGMMASVGMISLGINFGLDKFSYKMLNTHMLQVIRGV